VWQKDLSKENCRHTRHHYPPLSKTKMWHHAMATLLNCYMNCIIVEAKADCCNEFYEFNNNIV